MDFLHYKMKHFAKVFSNFPAIKTLSQVRVNIGNSNQDVQDGKNKINKVKISGEECEEF